jgi:hypothetical protein
VLKSNETLMFCDGRLEIQGHCINLRTGQTTKVSRGIALIIEAYGWKRPNDLDPNSTNCLLNTFAAHVHIKQMGYHAYALELAGLVREGYLERDEALRRLEIPQTPELLTAVAARLGVPDPL